MIIDVTKANLIKFVQAAYDLSFPQGMGFLHYQPTPLTDDEARELIKDTGDIALSMDYVKGRSCKMTVHREQDGRLWFRAPWYDHTTADLKKLLRRAGVGLPPVEKEKHSVGCNCADCVLVHGRS